jgi:diphthamide synthase (EF-2-diphthine--ammonia ligase)
VIFGDLFLADVRAYREQALAGSGISPLFPLWQRPTDALARDMIAAGIRAVLTCVDPSQLDPAFVGRQFDEDLLADLPDSVDPCGERGEFHTFVYDGPGFSSPVDVNVGEVVEREGFVFCDVLPA